MDVPFPPQEEAPPRDDIKKKATKHRKRHIPVGPAGVWFQSTVHPIASQRHGMDDRGQKRPLDVSEGKEEEDDNGDESMKPADFMVEDPRLSRHHPSSNYYLSPAWTSAHCSLHLVTPSLSSLRSAAQRASILRRYLPRPFVLFSDITSSEHQTERSWKMSPTDQLLCQVLSIRSDQSGTVARLRDEAGSLCSAWISPALVRVEATMAQSSHRPRTDVDTGAPTIYLRQGMVWLLQHCTLQLVDASLSSGYPHDHEYDSDDENDWIDSTEREGRRWQRSSFEQMLLVGESNLIQAWSNSNADQMDTAGYICWLEARNSLTMTVLNELSLVSPSANRNRRHSRTPQQNGVIPPATNINERTYDSASDMDPSIIPLCALQRVAPSNSQTQGIRRNGSNPTGTPPLPFTNTSRPQPRPASPTLRTTFVTERSTCPPLQQQITAAALSTISVAETLRSLEVDKRSNPSPNSAEHLHQISFSQFAAPSASQRPSSDEPLQRASPRPTNQEVANTTDPLKEVHLSQFVAPSTASSLIPKTVEHLVAKRTTPINRHHGKRRSTPLVATLNAGNKRSNVVSQPMSTSNLYSAAQSDCSMFDSFDIEEEDNIAAKTCVAPTIVNAASEIVVTQCHRKSINFVPPQSGVSSLYQSSFFLPSGMTIESMFDDLDD